jgi:hypothetical protein
MKSVLIKEKKIRTLLFLTIVIAPVALVVGVQMGNRTDLRLSRGAA